MIWEIYLDSCEDLDDVSNDNYSCFIKSKKKPTLEQAYECLEKNNQLEEGYTIHFIIKNTWDLKDIRKDILKL